LSDDVKTRASDQIHPGRHLCALAEGPDQAERIVLDLLQGAVQRGWALLYIASQRQHYHLRTLIRQQQLDPDDLLDRGLLDLAYPQDSYVHQGQPELPALLEDLQARCRQARAEGKDGLMVVMDMSWAAQQSAATLNALLDGSARMTAQIDQTSLCIAELYRKDQFHPTFLLELLAGQSHVVLDRRLYPNPFYVPDLSVLGPEASADVLEGILAEMRRRQGPPSAAADRRQTFRRYLHAAGVPILVLDQDARVVEINPSAEKIHGTSRDRALGCDYAETFVHPDDRPRFAAATAHVLESREPAALEARTVEEPGVLLWSLTALSDQAENSGRLLAIGQDITEQRQAEKQVAEAQKLETIGQLAGGIAHHFNNLLTIVMGNAELMQRTLGPGDECHHMAEQVIQAAQRASDLTSQLLAFARKGQFKVVSVDLHELIQRTVQLLTATIDRRVEIQLDLAADPSRTRGDPAQLENVMLNLGLNARDAMPQGGQLVLSTENVEVADAEQDPEELPPGSYVRLRVRDTGVGMDAETRDRVFEPFFTTKEVGKGAGLGLASVYGAVQNHGGAIEVFSTPGDGTTFDVFLPAEAPEPVSAPAPEEPPPTRAGRILLVDDEESVRAFGAEVLRREGYEVVTCPNGSEAVEIYRQDQAFDLVILDMVMPKLDGLDTFRRLRQIDPSIRAMLSSGFSISDLPQEILDEGVVDFLAKPYRIEQLTDKVRRAIQREA
jgi:PAS domain S-box-containing protein